MNQSVYDIYEELTEQANCAISLPKYAQMIGYDECAFFGVVYEGQAQAACNDLWSEYQRLEMAQALAEAQADMEDVIGYPLCPTWIVGTPDEEPGGDLRRVDQQAYSRVQAARYPHVLEVGARATETVAAGAAVNHAGDPATVGPLATSALHSQEIKVYYPGSRREIVPSKVTMAGGDMTIEIPRCRLVRPDLLNNPRGGWGYEQTANFLAEVDVEREYVDPSRNAVLVRRDCECKSGCGDCTQDACIYVKDWEAGIFHVRPAVYEDGVWQPRSLTRRYDQVRLYYRAGARRLSPRLEASIVRLAHSKAPEAPCSCPHTEHLWRRDRNVPEVLTKERLNCPFGLSDGAWIAYRTAMLMRHERADVL